MKILSRDDKRRPNDAQDLVNLVSVAAPEDLEQAREALELIESRGYGREKDLLHDLAQLEREQG
jgi:hypothetical protein